MIDETSKANSSFTLANYRQLAELRFRIRQYLQFSEQVARTHGIEPQQHQLMLTIKGLPANVAPTVSTIANRLCLKHHSTVELINRLVQRGSALRKQCEEDRRQVLVELTPEGEDLLAKLNADHDTELRKYAPELVGHLNAILAHPFATEDDGTEGNYSNKGHLDAAPSIPEKLESAAASLN